MTLAELADIICTKLSITETEDITACKKFLKQRFKMIWNDQLWKDSLFEYTQSLASTGYTNTSTWLPTNQILLVPPIFDRVVAVRCATQKISVTASDSLYRMDFDCFNNTGSPVQFRLLPKCVWQLDAAASLFLSGGSSADFGSTVNIDLLDDDAITAVRSGPVLAANGISLGSLLRIDAISKDATTGPVVVATSGLSSLITAGTFYDQPSGPPAYYTYTVSGFIVGQTYTLTLANGTQLAAFNLSTGQLEIYTMDTTFVAGNTAYSLNGPYYNSASLPAPPVVITTSVVLAGTSVVTLQAADLFAVQRERIQLIGPMPSQPTVIRVLGKTVSPVFEADGDEPRLSNIENVLLAYAEADVLKYIRQFGKAASVIQEATALLEQLKRVEVVQQAFHAQIQPSGGFGEINDWLGSAFSQEKW